MNIKKLDKESISKICINQVIIDMPMAIKELVENSLDAQSTDIEIITYNNGLDGFEIRDNGTGISMDNFENFTQKGSTSKIRSYGDLSSVKTFGFRGEALNAIARMSKMKIITKIEGNEEAWELEFDDNYNIIAKNSTNRCEHGTTITITNLFFNLPVRFAEFKSNYKTQFTKCISLIESYAIIVEGVKITLANNTQNNNRQLVLSNLKRNVNYKDNIIAILGKKLYETLGEINFVNDYLKIQGYCTKLIQSGSIQSSLLKKDMIYFYVNKRPINMQKKMISLFNDLYRQFNPGAKYCIVLNLIIDAGEYDVNVSPDKRDIHFKNQEKVIMSLKKCMEEFIELERSKAKMLNVESSQKTIEQMHNPIGKSKSIQGNDHSKVNKAKGNDECKKGNNTKGENGKGEDGAGNTKGENEKKKEVKNLKRKYIESSQSAHLDNTSNDIDDNIDKDINIIDDENARKKLKLTLKSNNNDNNGDVNDGNNDNQFHVFRSKTQEIDDDDNNRNKEIIMENTWNIESNRIITNNNQEIRTNIIKNPRENMFSECFKGFSSKDLMQNNLKESRDKEFRIKEVRDNEFQANESQDMEFQAKESQNEDFTRNRIQIDEEKPGFILKNITFDLSNFGSYSKPSMNFQELSTSLKVIGNRYEKIYSQSQREMDIQDEIDDDNNDEDINSSIKDINNSILDINSSSKGFEYLNTGIDTSCKDIDISNKDIATSTKDMHNDSNKNFTIKQITFGSLNPKPEKIIMNQSNIPRIITQTIDNSNMYIVDPIKGIRNKQDIIQMPLEDISSNIARSFKKNEFLDLLIIGQFNLGFIVAFKLDNHEIFIIDQHAADEKYNFEGLMLSAKIETQVLIKPIAVELPMSKIHTVIDNEQIMRKNGYEFKIHKGEDIKNCVYLVQIPMSKGTIFGEADFIELVDLLERNSYLKEEIRTSKVKIMFASRACRKSIMVGDPLDKKMMSKVVRNLSTLKSPWNCPHG